MAIACEVHSAHIYDRGGQRLMGALDNLQRVDWSRERDETSTAKVVVGASRSPHCNNLLGLLSAGRHEIAIYRGQIRVWEGPITLLTYKQGEVTIDARDVSHYLNRLNITREYDNSYPNIRTVVKHVERVFTRELVRLENQVPPNNILAHAVFHHHEDDAGTSSHILPYQYNVYENLDNMAARSGLDYTVIGRAIHVWDVHRAVMGQTVVVTEDDFLDNPIISEYGMELVTIAAVTDGKGRAGVVGSPDPFYGRVEMLETAYDEETGEELEGGGEPPSIAELRSQALRLLAGGNPTPTVVRVPDNSGLNPNGVLGVNDLIPGARIPLRAEVPGRTLSQMQVLQTVKFSETADEGETINVVMNPSPNGSIPTDRED